MAATRKKAGKGEVTLPEEIETKAVKEEPAEIEPVHEIEKTRKEEPREKFREEAREEKPAKESPYQEHITQLSGTLSARLIDEGNSVINEVPVRDLATALRESDGNIKSVVFDGVITQRIVDIASEKGIETLIGAKIGNLVKTPTTIHIESSKDL